jgi:hypothetical protein
MGPQRYRRLRRLKLVRADLCANDVVGQDVPAIIARYGFPNLHRSIREYWDTYGEPCSGDYKLEVAIFA